MTWPAIAIVLILASVVLGQLAILVAGWPLGDRTRRVVAGIGWLALAFPGALLLSRLVGADPSWLVEAEGEPKPVRGVIASLSAATMLLSFALSDRREQGGLTARLALAAVMLLGAGLSISRLLPLASADHRRAFVNLSGSEFALIVMGFAFSSFRPWTTYGAGLLIAASSAFISSSLTLGPHALPISTLPVILGLSATDLVLVVGVLIGMVMTLYGNLRHPVQWLAAGAGVAAVVGSVISGAGLNSASNTNVLMFWAGLLTILFAPRLIGMFMMKARNGR